VECLAGNREAWGELYKRLLQRAPNAIYRARKSVKRYAPEEVAGQVWGDLRENKEKLQVFLQGTKGLDAFLDNLLLALRRKGRPALRRGVRRRSPFTLGQR
jgi:hypothetical protein